MDSHAVCRAVERRADDQVLAGTSIALPITQAAGSASAAIGPTRRQSTTAAPAITTPETSTEHGYVQRSSSLIAVAEWRVNGR